jgi:hypothetical protein
MRRTPVALAAAAFLLAGAAQAQEEQWLQYRMSREPQRSGIDISARRLEFTNSAGEGGVPAELKADDVRFGEWATPMDQNGRRRFAIDRSGGRRSRYDLLYIDSNGDGSLADEEGEKAYSVLPNESRFGPVKVVFKGPDGPVTSHVNIVSYEHPTYNAVVLSSAGWYEGTVEVGGRQYECRLIDHNSNGTYDDASMDFSQVDYIWVGAGGQTGRFFAGKYILIDGKYYHPEPARDGAFIKFTPAENVPLGTVRVGEGVDQFSVGGENGFLRLELAEGAAGVPAGKWRVSEWSMAKTDAAGARWTLRGWGFGDQGVFEAGEGREVSLAVGEPIISTLVVGKSGEEWIFSEALTGALGERLDMRRNNSLPAAPKVRIRNEDASYERVYSFSYG